MNGILRRINDLRMTNKLLIAPGVVIAFLLLFGVIAYKGITTEKAAVDEIYTQRFKHYQDAARMLNAGNSANGDLYRLISWARANYAVARIDEVGKNLLASLDTMIVLAQQHAKTEENANSRRLYESILEKGTAFRKASADVIDFASFDLNTATMAVGTADGKYEEMEKVLLELQIREDNASRLSYEQALASSGAAVFWLIVILLVALGLSLVIVLFMNKMIVGPIQKTSDVLKILAAGDLTHEVPVYGRDEIGVMSENFNAMVTSLRKVLGDLRSTTEAVASASTQIMSSTEQMAAGAQEQTTQAAEVAGAVEEMTKTIVENSRNATATAETAAHAKQAAQQGGGIVEEAVMGMRRIAEVVKVSAGTVQELGKSSQQIGEIISVIDDIADQTNLLALNAAIEAARAGEQGRGFAVVADEVRKLAERTTKATKEIAVMIRKIQEDTRGAVTSMDEGTKQVDEGIRLADKAGNSLQEIMEMSQKVTDMVSQIAAASGQQSSTSTEIAKNVEAISAVTGETAGSTQHIAMAAEDLNRLTESLLHTVEQFKLSNEEHSPAAPHRGAAPARR